MGSSKNKRHKPEPGEAGWPWLTQAGLWINEIANYRILRIAVWAWLLILTLILGLPGLMYFQVSHMLSEPVISETFIAKVSDMQVEDHSVYPKVSLVYRIRLKQNDKEFPCIMGPAAVQMWYRLEIGKSYEFTVTQNPSTCYVNKVTTIDEPHPFGIGK